MVVDFLQALRVRRIAPAQGLDACLLQLCYLVFGRDRWALLDDALHRPAVETGVAQLTSTGAPGIAEATEVRLKGRGAHGANAGYARKRHSVLQFICADRH